MFSIKSVIAEIKNMYYYISFYISSYLLLGTGPMSNQMFIIKKNSKDHPSRHHFEPLKTTNLSSQWKEHSPRHRWHQLQLQPSSASLPRPDPTAENHAVPAINTTLLKSFTTHWLHDSVLRRCWLGNNRNPATDTRTHTLQKHSGFSLINY